MAFPTAEDLITSLQNIGAVVISRNAMDQDGEELQLTYLRYGPYILKVTSGNYSGLSCFASKASTIDTATKIGFASVFSLTVPGYADFSVDERIDWISSVPKDGSFVNFTARHVLLLPQ